MPSLRAAVFSLPLVIAGSGELLVPATTTTAAGGPVHRDLGDEGGGSSCPDPDDHCDDFGTTICGGESYPDPNCLPNTCICNPSGKRRDDRCTRMACERDCSDSTVVMTVCIHDGQYYCEGDVFYDTTCMPNICRCEMGGWVDCTGEWECVTPQCESNDDCAAVVRSQTAQSELYPLCRCEARSLIEEIEKRFDECLGEDEKDNGCAQARCSNTCEGWMATCNTDVGKCELVPTDGGGSGGDAGVEEEGNVDDEEDPPAGAESTISPPEQDDATLEEACAGVDDRAVSCGATDNGRRPINCCEGLVCRPQGDGGALRPICVEPPPTISSAPTPSPSVSPVTSTNEPIIGPTEALGTQIPTMAEATLPIIDDPTFSMPTSLSTMEPSGEGTPLPSLTDRDPGPGEEEDGDDPTSSASTVSLAKMSFVCSSAALVQLLLLFCY